MCLRFSTYGFAKFSHCPSRSFVVFYHSHLFFPGGHCIFIYKKRVKRKNQALSTGFVPVKTPSHWPPGRLLHLQIIHARRPWTAPPGVFFYDYKNSRLSFPLSETVRCDSCPGDAGHSSRCCFAGRNPWSCFSPPD